MDIVFPLVLLIIGLVCVVKGADFLVNGSSSLAKRFSIPEITIGLTIVAFGTSAPELIVTIFSSISNKNEIVLGNAIGSNIFNIMLILGMSGLLYPLKIQKNTVWREIPFSFIAILVLFLLVNDNMIWRLQTEHLSRIDGLLLLVLFTIFIIYIFGFSKVKSADEYDVKVHSIPKTIIYIVIGFIGLFIGAKLVVDNTVVIAKQLKVSEKLIALTIVSGGTSLPELAVCSVAALKKRSDIAVGNIVGSNIFNIFLILGTSSLIKPVKYDIAFNFELYVLTISTALLFVTMFTGKKHKLDRWEAFLLLILYIGYMAFIIHRK